MNNDQSRIKETELGSIPVDWNVDKLSNIAKTYTGGTPRRDNPDYWKGSIGWLKSGELRDCLIDSTEEYITEKGFKNSSTKYVYPDSVLIALYGATAGKVGLVKSKFTINQAICCIQPFENLYHTFCYFYLQTIREQLLSERYGGAQPNLSQQIIKNLQIPLPPLPEQKKIAAVLSAVQEAKEKTEAVITVSKELKKSLMKYLFTYGPVPIDEADKVPLKETEIGMVPEEWEVVEFPEILSKSKFKANRILQRDFKKVGKYPIIDQSKEAIAGYWDNESDLYSGSLPVIIFGDHTRVFKYVDFPFVRGADGTQIINPNQNRFNSKYIFYALSNI